MNKDQWQQIEKIFYAAMELPRDERKAFLNQACAGDEELLREVQALLMANQDAESFLDSPVNMPPHSGTFSPTLGHSIAIARLPLGSSGRVEAEIRGRRLPAQVVKLPFVRHGQPLHPSVTPASA